MNLNKVIAILVIVVALFHTLITFVVFTSPEGNGLLNDGIKGITGRVSFDIPTNFSQLETTHIIVLAVEWILVTIIIIVVLVKGKMRLSKDIKDTRDITRHGVQFKKERQETDLDLLYKLLKEKKVLRLAVISGVFGVGRSTALEWARILEAGDLATIRYPTVGDPKILLNEGEKSEDDEY